MITWLPATRWRVLKLGALMSVALAAGVAGPLDAATAAPAVTRTALLAWGQNAFGQLGNGKTTDSDVPVTVKLPSGVRAAQVRGGGNFAVALTVGDGVFAWGNNRSGQLGAGRIIRQPRPGAGALAAAGRDPYRPGSRRQFLRARADLNRSGLGLGRRASR